MSSARAASTKGTRWFCPGQWESCDFPNTGSPWICVHPASGNGSAPHAWGIANANKVLLDSLAAQRSDGTLIVGGDPVKLADQLTVTLGSTTRSVVVQLRRAA
jgi:hypothetical protein